MKTWLKIFKNETVSTPLEIMAEIKNLESEKKSAQEVFTELQGMLESKRVVFLGGTGSINEVKKLKAQVSDARENIEALDLALEKLQQLYKIAMAREKDSAVAGIDKALVKLEADRQELTKKFLIAEETLKEQQNTLAELTFKASANTSINIMFFSALIRANPSLLEYFTEIITQTLDRLKQMQQDPSKNYVPNIYLTGQLKSILKAIQNPLEHPHLKIVED